MPKLTPDEQRREGLTNLGHAVRALVWALPGHRPEDEYQLGRTLAAAIKASVKAVDPGRQSTAQVRAHLDAAVKAANRHLARVVKRGDG